MSVLLHAVSMQIVVHYNPIVLTQFQLSYVSRFLLQCFFPSYLFSPASKLYRDKSILTFNICIWNPYQWYKIRGFGTYHYVPVCTCMYQYTIVCMVHTSMYQYVPSLYSFFTSNIAVNWGNILVFNHNYMTVLYTEYLLPLSKFTK